MTRERRETSSTDDDEGAFQLPGVPVSTTTTTRTEPRKRAANRAAVRRYRHRQRARTGALARECEALRETNARLEGELAHARWVLAEVRRRYGLDDGDRATSAHWTMTSTIAHGIGCPLGEEGMGRGGPFRLREDGGENGGTTTTTTGKRRRRGRGREDVRSGGDEEDDLAEFLNTFLVHDDGCPCPGHSHHA